MLFQLPIYIALYSMLGNAVELYRSPFLWVHDLTAPDPLYILPIATGVLMFVQQKTQPTPADPNQKVMMYAMPVMFTVFNLVWPAGLTIYILTNTILTFVQQLLMNRGEKSGAPTAKPARA
jgi:YidC/Oxa1 family membrane protein insertase